MKKLCVLFIVVVASLVLQPRALLAESHDTEGFSLVLIPGISMPMGEDASYFSLGGGATLLGRLSIPSLQNLYFEAGADFNLSPIKVAADKSYPGAMLDILSGSVGLGLRYQLFPGFYAGVSAHGGYYYGFTNYSSSTGNNPYADAGVELKYRLTPALNLGIDASYRLFFGLLSEIRAGLGVSYNFPVGSKATILGPQSKPNPQLELLNASFNDVFPVFYKYYSDHPIGKIEIANSGKIPLEKVKVKAFVNQFMDNPFLCKEIPFITGGGREVVDLYALFNDRVLEITENTTVQINITVESETAGESYGNEHVSSIRVYDRNAMSWEDDRRAAAFVSLKDPTVLKFSKNISSYVKDRASRAINKNLLLALAFFESVRIYGMSYAIDPTTPFTEFSKNKSAVDFLQFPRQTLDYKAGDCDDLSILYCALLESVGIKSAFLTVPGHIFAAASLDLAPADARKMFSSVDDLILTDDGTWVPVEITALNSGFLDAWRSGANLWREKYKAGQARMIVLQEAWRTYEPVGFGGEATPFAVPGEDQVVSAYLKEVMKYIDRELLPQTARMGQQIRQNPRDITLVNKLGVLYARYGVFEKAEEQFQQVLKAQEYGPALVNMGNLMYFQGKLPEALRYYERALAKTPTHPAVVLSLAKINFELGKYEKTDAFYAQLKRLDAPMAERFSYLGRKDNGDTARAANAETMKEVVVWAE